MNNITLLKNTTSRIFDASLEQAASGIGLYVSANKTLVWYGGNNNEATGGDWTNYPNAEN